MPSSVLPARIEIDAQHDAARTRFGELLRKARCNKAEHRLMDLLGVLIEDFDRRDSLPPDDGIPSERLRFLMEHSAKPSSDLLPVFGQRSHVKEALNGKRPISTEQARKLVKMFAVSPACSSGDRSRRIRHQLNSRKPCGARL